MAPKRKRSSGNLDGFCICISGNFAGTTKAKLSTEIEENGGTIAKSVTKACTHLLHDGEPSDKWAKAKGDEKEIWSWKQYRACVDGKGGGAATKATKAKGAKPPPKKKRGKQVVESESESESEEEESEEDSDEESSSEDEAEENAPVMKKMAKKGRGVVDEHSGMSSKVHVYDDGTDVWQCTLNQTNIGANNNKFYMIELYESDAGGQYWTWNRWARVGVVGQNKLTPFGANLAGAKADFQKKFKDKTTCHWANKANFKKVPGKYHYMEMDYGADDDEEETTSKAKNLKVPESKLDKELQDFITLISDTKMMTKAMAELNVDVKKMPLGKIKKKQVMDAYEILKTIEAILEKKAKGDLTELSSQFYTLVPHNFGMRIPPPIKDIDTLKKKMEMLDCLADLEIASKLIKDAGDGPVVNPIDANYAKLGCEIKPIGKKTKLYKMLEEYVDNTHGVTHTAFRLEVLDIFECSRAGEAKRFKKYEKLDNQALLWHGSRLTNWMGILSQGLRIAPPEAPCTGYMFGKGVYFADMVTKSANYCRTSRSDNIGVMVLNQVALGKKKAYRASNYMEKPADGTDSTFAEGQMMPDPEADKELDGCQLPSGKPIQALKRDETHLLYNEFITYDESQSKMKYLFRLRFNYGYKN